MRVGRLSACAGAGGVYAGRMSRRSPKPSPFVTKGIHVFTNCEGGITIGQTLGDDTEIHVSLTAAEARIVLAKLPQMLAELEEP